MTIRKNVTIIVLATIIISSLAINALAVNNIVDWSGLSEVTVLRKRVVGCYPLAEEAQLKTSSTEHEHTSYAEMGCFICGGWVGEESPLASKTPDSVSVVKEFDYDCFAGSDEHCTAGFNAYIVRSDD